jgi:hypothetical protein
MPKSSSTKNRDRSTFKSGKIPSKKGSDRKLQYSKPTTIKIKSKKASVPEPEPEHEDEDEDKDEDFDEEEMDDYDLEEDDDDDGSLEALEFDESDDAVEDSDEEIAKGIAQSQKKGIMST